MYKTSGILSKFLMRKSSETGLILPNLLPLRAPADPTLSPVKSWPRQR